jgi:hypothetical protein
MFPVPTSSSFFTYFYYEFFLTFPFRDGGYEGDEMGGGMFHMHMNVEVVLKIVLFLCHFNYLLELSIL